MLRIAAIGDEISQDLSEVIALTKAHGFDGVEIRSVWGKAPLDLTRVDCDRVVRKLHSAGLEVAAFASPAFKTKLPTTSQERAAARDTYARSLQRAEWLTAPLLRVFSFLRRGNANPTAAADAMGTLVESVGRSSASVAVETGTKTNTPNAATMSELLSDLNIPEIGVVWDPGNGVFSGFDPAPFPDSYKLLAKVIQHVHVKDPQGTEFYTELGRGDVPWKEILAQLQVDGFQGYVSLETHWRVGRELTKKQRDCPCGIKFSAGAYAASDRCMAVLKTMLKAPSP